MPSPSRRPQADGQSVTYRDSDGQRRRRVFASHHLAAQFQHGLAAGQAPADPPAPDWSTGPARTPAPPAHHRSIHPLRQFTRTIIDDCTAGLAFTFLPAPDVDDIEQDWPVAPSDAQRHLIFRQPR
jgi:hypothetical protein